MERRRLTRAELSLIVVGLVLGLVAQVPGVVTTGGVLPRPVPLLGAVYRDAQPTPFGLFVYAASGFFVLWLTVHHAAAALRRVPWALHHALGMGALLVAVVHDCFAVAGASSAPYFLDAGFLVVMLSVGSTIAQRYVLNERALERASAELRQAQADLVQQERLAALGEMSAQVAHEVRQPVGVMFNVLAALQRPGVVKDDARRLLSIMDEEAARLRQIVDDLLTFAGPAPLERESVDLGELALAAVEAVTAALPVDGATVEVEPAEALPLAHCNARLVRQAISNLVANALNAAPHGRVRVSLRRADGCVRVEVSDDGKGVPPELAARLFTPFFTTRARGTGLGLAIVRRAAEAHGGRAFLGEPRDGRGATFVLELPLELRGPTPVSHPPSEVWPARRPPAPRPSAP